MKNIHLKHPNIVNYWISHLIDPDNTPHDTLVVITQLKPAGEEGFSDERFPDLVGYIRDKIRPYKSKLSDIEIRSTVH